MCNLPGPLGTVIGILVYWAWMCSLETLGVAWICRSPFGAMTWRWGIATAEAVPRVMALTRRSLYCIV